MKRSNAIGWGYNKENDVPFPITAKEKDKYSGLLEQQKVKKYKTQKRSNITYDDYKEALNKVENWQTSDEEKKQHESTIKRYEKKEKHLITRQKNKNAKENLKNELNWRGLSQEEIEKGFKLPYQDKLKKEQQKKLIEYYKKRKGK